MKVDSLDFTCRLSPRRRCPRRMTPRRKAETDIHETGGTDGWRRRMALGGKAWTEGSSVFMAFRPRDILLCHSSWPSQSRKRMAPKRMSPRRRKAALDGCLRDRGRPPETEEGRPRRRKAARDGGRPPETDVAEMDVPETEGVFFQALILSDLSECD